LCRVLTFNSPDQRIATAARIHLETDIQLNQHFTTAEVRDLVKHLAETDVKDKKKKPRQKKGKEDSTSN
jgi:hypothetical protein